MRINRSVKSVDFDQGQGIDTMLENNCRNSRVPTAIKCFLFTASHVVKHILGYCVYPTTLLERTTYDEIQTTHSLDSYQILENNQWNDAWNWTADLQSQGDQSSLTSVRSITDGFSKMAASKTAFYWLFSSAGIPTFNFIWNPALDQQFSCWSKLKDQGLETMFLWGSCFWDNSYPQAGLYCVTWWNITVLFTNKENGLVVKLVKEFGRDSQKKILKNKLFLTAMFSYCLTQVWS